VHALGSQKRGFRTANLHEDEEKPFSLQTIQSQHRDFCCTDPDWWCQLATIARLLVFSRACCGYFINQQCWITAMHIPPLMLLSSRNEKSIGGPDATAEKPEPLPGEVGDAKGDDGWLGAIVRWFRLLS
jgi:hypothetical protein